MELRQATEIAQLLNSRNQLEIPYTADKVLEHANNYVFDLDDQAVVACVEIKKVQWYQWEICHLSVAETHEGQGRGKALISRAEGKAKAGRARLVQCTIRVGNEPSERAFRRSGYRETCCFFNVGTGNYVAVWQKVLCTS